MANAEKQGKAAKVPSRAASLQRMLEIERKQKMERMQLQNPNSATAPGRRGVSPASQTSSSSSSRASVLLLHRRRDSSQNRQQQQQQQQHSQPDDRMMNTARDYTLPPLAIHTQPKKRISLMPSLNTANLSEPKDQSKPKHDRLSLPSMVKAATAGHEPSSLNMVAYAAAEDGNETEGSSICHSPTWDDYGRKKKKKEKERERERKEQETKRKRLTKEPPPAALDRLSMNPRAATEPTLSVQQLKQSLETSNSSLQLRSASTEPPQPLTVVDTVPRSPSFIGGVRLEREREAVMKRMMNSRAPSVERPASELQLRIPQADQSEPKTPLDKKRETAPAISYPPTSSRPPRARRGSFGQGLKNAAGKLFNSKDSKDKERAESRASVEIVDAEARGRQMSGSTGTSSRGQSYDSHVGYPEGPRRGAVSSQPPMSWQNSRKQGRTISMMAVPPNSARDEFFPSMDPGLKEDNFDFLDRPFSPSTTSPESPTPSVSASAKAKFSPAVTPTSASTPAKKTFREALKAGFRSSTGFTEARTEAKPARSRSGTLDTLVGADFDGPRRDDAPLTNNPEPSGSVAAAVAALNGRAYPANAVRRSDEQQQIGQAHSGDSKDSRTSSASSHPDSESLPPSPMTTPEGSRPQSKKENQAFRNEELKRPPPLSYENVIAMRGSPTLPPRTSGYFPPNKTVSPRISVEKPPASEATPKPSSLVHARRQQQQGRSGSNFVEEFSPTSPNKPQGFLTDELWSQTRKPLDPDQLSFTSALTSLDVKTSFTDLNSALQSPNGDVTPLSLEDATKSLNAKKLEPQASMGFQFDLPTKTSTTTTTITSTRPASLPHPASTPRINGGLLQFPGSASSQRSPYTWATGSANAAVPVQPARKASDYLQEARKAAPASPRGPLLSATSTSPASVPTPSSSGSSSVPRAFALSKPKQQQQSAAVTTTTTTTSSTAAASMPRGGAAATAAGGAGSAMPTPTAPLVGAPISKMLVECCHCKFYHDMPSRVYEAMARPDDVVKDKILGVSGQVTTCVKCPWCAHNMSTVCCAGYAAVVYLREKLHGP